MLFNSLNLQLFLNKIFSLNLKKKLKNIQARHMACMLFSFFFRFREKPPKPEPPKHFFWILSILHVQSLMLMLCGV